MENYKDNIEIEDAIAILSENSLAESEGKQIVESFMLDQLSKLRSTMKDPSDLDEFMKKHQAEIAALEKQQSSKAKTVVLKAWEFMKHAAKMGWAFIKKHWKKILLLVLLVAAFFLFKNAKGVTKLGAMLFSNGSVTSIDDVPSTLAKAGNEVVKQWIPVSADDVDDIATEIGNGLWQSNQTSTGKTVIGLLTDPSDPSSPMNWYIKD